MNHQASQKVEQIISKLNEEVKAETMGFFSKIQPGRFTISMQANRAINQIIDVMRGKA